MTIKLTYPNILVLIQFVSLGLLALTHPLLPGTLVGLASVILGFVIGTWAVLAMRQSVLNVTPTLDPKATLVTSGPYRFVRHPMYTAVILTAFGLWWEQPSVLRLVMLGLLCLDLILKIQYEETLLSSKFPQYRAYRQKTGRLVPFLF